MATALPHPACTEGSQEFWRKRIITAGQRLDRARQRMDEINQAPAYSEGEFGRAERDLLESRMFYRSAVEMLTGQSADDVQRRMEA